MTESLKNKLLIGLCILSVLNLVTPNTPFFTAAGFGIALISLGIILTKEKD
jgi:FtsH-binding integral membrane protein